MKLYFLSAIIIAVLSQNILAKDTHRPPAKDKPDFELFREHQEKHREREALNQVIPNHYIVVLKPDVNDVDIKASEVSARGGVKTTRTFNHVLKGFTVEVNDPNDMDDILFNDEDIAYVTEDKRIHADLTRQNPTPCWGIDRIDEEDLPLNEVYEYEYTGKEVEIYIFDT